MREVIGEILEEPTYGECGITQLEFLHEFNRQIESEEWFTFVYQIHTVIQDLIFGPHRNILPLHQYEDNTKNLNSFLNKNQAVLAEKLAQISETVLMDNCLAGRLVMRIAFKLHTKETVWYFKSLRSITEDIHAELGVEEQEQWDEIQNRAFAQFVARLLRIFLKTILVNRCANLSKVVDAVSTCLRATFVTGQPPILTKDFLREKNWFSGEERSLVLSSNASDFFENIEKEIIPQMVSKMDVQELVGRVLEDSAQLHYWYHLTNPYFPTEEVSLIFMRELLSLYLKTSRVLRDQLATRMEEKSVRSATTAIRTHLQHNLVEKETLQEEDEDNI